VASLCGQSKEALDSIKGDGGKFLSCSANISLSKVISSTEYVSNFFYLENFRIRISS
jgi:hypothetical protein